MRTARFVVTMLDGTKHDVVGVYMALGDRIEYERVYARSIFDKGKIDMQADGSGSATVDMNKVEEESRVFFVWKMLQRAEVPVGSFDDFWPGLESMDGPEFLDGPLDPTVEDQQPGSLPS
jgi:hypothetical protein